MGLTHYEVLGVAPDADLATIRAAYRRRARQTHPDVGGDEAEFASVSLAWWTLSSPERRALYDAGDVDDDGWGADLGWEDAVPEPVPAAAPAPAPDTLADASDTSTDPPREEARDGEEPDRGPPPTPAGPRPVDAFTSEPRVLPARPRRSSTHVSDAWNPTHRVPFLAGSVGLLLLVAVVFTLPWPVAGLGSVVGAGIIAYAATLFFALWLRFLAHEAARGMRFVAATLVWGSVAVFALMGAGYLFESVSPARLVVVVAPSVVGLALAVHSGVRLRAARARAEQRRHAGRRWDLAHRWNQLLKLRGEHLAARIEVGERDGQVVWVLVADGSRETLGWAPSGAPLAWARLIRGLGLDVAKVPRPTPTTAPGAAGEARPSRRTSSTSA